MRELNHSYIKLVFDDGRVSEEGLMRCLDIIGELSGRKHVNPFTIPPVERHYTRVDIRDTKEQLDSESSSLLKALVLLFIKTCDHIGPQKVQENTSDFRVIVHDLHSALEEELVQALYQEKLVPSIHVTADELCAQLRQLGVQLRKHEVNSRGTRPMHYHTWKVDTERHPNLQEAIMTSGASACLSVLQMFDFVSTSIQNDINRQVIGWEHPQ